MILRPGLEVIKLSSHFFLAHTPKSPNQNSEFSFIPYIFFVDVAAMQIYLDINICFTFYLFFIILQSDEVMTFVMYIMKECGCRNVPPLSKIKKYLQTKMEMEDMIQKVIHLF